MHIAQFEIDWLSLIIGWFAFLTLQVSYSLYSAEKLECLEPAVFLALTWLCVFSHVVCISQVIM